MMHQLLYIHWDPDPTIFGFFSWYGLLFASSFAVGYWIMGRVFRTEKVHSYYLEALTIYMGVSTVLGARLGHCLFYDPEYYLSHPLEILMIWKGGLASHGAAIGIITGLWLWSRLVSKRSVLWILDRIVIMVALSGLFIRTGNLVNSEILGSPTESSVGFVFPRADQSLAFEAKYVGQDVELRYAPLGSKSSYFSIYRLEGDSLLTEVPGPAVQATLKGEPAFQMTDRGAGKREKRYWAVGRGGSHVEQVPGIDSADTRVVKLEHEFNPAQASFQGKWQGASVALHFEMRGMDPGMVAPLAILRSVDGGPWVLAGRGALGGSMQVAAFDTTITPPAFSKEVRYKILEKEQEIHLVARHASMMYEAFFYTVVFAFLLWSYFKKQGRVEQGLFFGIFLVLVFSGRIAIEFLKENQEAFNLGIPLNMGQLLSVPFVLLGVFMILRARRVGVVDEPPFPPVPEDKKTKDKPAA